MSVLTKLASASNRKDDVPNQILAKEIAEIRDSTAIQELVANLFHPDKAIQSDCIKVLYEVGSLQPDLIAPYTAEFVRLLHSRNNRLVWGAMTALGAVADKKADDLWSQIDVILDVTQRGSVITQDWGIRVLAAVSAKDKTYERRILPYLKTVLQKCRPKDFPRHAESCMSAVNAENYTEILPILEARMRYLNPSEVKRVEKVIRKISAVA